MASSRCISIGKKNMFLKLSAFELGFINYVFTIFNLCTNIRKNILFYYISTYNSWPEFPRIQIFHFVGVCIIVNLD